MKTIRLNKLAQAAGFSIVAALAVGAASILSAGDGSTGKGGATRLLDVKESAVAAKPANARPMSCTSCQDEFVKRVDWTARGAIKPTATIARHLCGSCVNTYSSSGHGKAKVTAVVHGCGGCGG